MFCFFPPGPGDDNGTHFVPQNCNLLFHVAILHSHEFCVQSTTRNAQSTVHTFLIGILCGFLTFSVRVLPFADQLLSVAGIHGVQRWDDRCENNFKGSGRKRSWPIFIYYPSAYLGGSRNTRNLKVVGFPAKIRTNNLRNTSCNCTAIPSCSVFIY